MRLTELQRLHDDASAMIGALGQVLVLSETIDRALVAEGRVAYWGAAFRSGVETQRVKCQTLLDKLRAKTTDVGDL